MLVVAASKITNILVSFLILQYCLSFHTLYYTVLCLICLIREYLMFYGGPGFLTVMSFGSSPPPFPASKFSFFLNLPVCRPSSLLRGRVDGGGRSHIIRGQESLVLYNQINSLVLPFCAQGWLPPENEESKQQDFQARRCHRANKGSMQLLQLTSTVELLQTPVSKYFY
jgi:hypothetical protein